MQIASLMSLSFVLGWLFAEYYNLKRVIKELKEYRNILEKHRE